MKRLFFVFLSFFLIFSNNGYSNSNPNNPVKLAYVLAFSGVTETPNEIAQELTELGVEVLEIVDKFPDGKKRRLKWIEISIEAKQIRMLREAYFTREGSWYLVTAQEWYKDYPKPIYFSGMSKNILTQNCDKLFF